MNFILLLLLNAAIILLLSKWLPSVVIKNFRTALSVALLIGLLNATIGFLLRLPLNLVSLFFLTFFVRLFVTAVMIKLAAFFIKGFEVKTFVAALILALAMALASAGFEKMVEKDQDRTNTRHLNRH